MDTEASADKLTVLGLTEEKSVAGAALTSHVSAVEPFLSHSWLRSLQLEPEKLVSYVEDKFVEGKSAGHGNRLVTSIQYITPCYDRRGWQCLRRPARALKGLEPTQQGKTDLVSRRSEPQLTCPIGG